MKRLVLVIGAGGFAVTAWLALPLAPQPSKTDLQVVYTPPNKGGPKRTDGTGTRLFIEGADNG